MVEESSELIKLIPSKIINALADEMKPSYFMKGEDVVRQGEAGASMYFISQGKVEVLINDKSVAQLTDGSCFGELSLLFDEPRTATVRILENSELFILEKESFNSIMKKNKDAMIAFSKLKKRVNTTNENSAEL